ncbi:MAG TPA: FAD-dependent oxidoreductase [Candidatus Limnocylindrales bacterium]|nr:FAD-dependent oxidoreductase [Candidatus Limnocylindrales bacterium]
MAYVSDPTSISGSAGSIPGRGETDVVVIGGGLAGLTAAAFAARSGVRVTVLERTEEVGGRAATHDENGFRFNVGPHALYDGGPAMKAFAELGVSFSGRRPPTSGGLAFDRGTLHALPGGFVSLLTTDLLGLSGKLELARVLGSLAKIDAKSLRGRTLRDWLDATFRDRTVRALVEALMRLTAYANDPSRSSAEASVAQLQAGLGKGVLYLDGGWATLAAGLAKVAGDAGAVIRTGARVTAVRTFSGHVEVDAGEASLRARVAVLAVPPGVAASLAKGEGAATIEAWAADAIPVKAACLDLGLRRLPDPRRLFVLGIDRPFYFSVHSASAKLAPEGGAVVHVAKYLGPEPADAKAVEAELEAFADVVQPGWRSELVERRYLPQMLVTGALVQAGRSRPGPDVPGTPSLVVAGDWVGDESMIADTAVSSGRRAGLIAADRAGMAGSKRDGAGAKGSLPRAIREVASYAADTMATVA